MLSLLRRGRGAGTNRAVDPGRGLRTGARGRPRKRSAARGLRPATHGDRAVGNRHVLLSVREPGELGPGRRREISCKETFRVDSMPPGGNSWTRNRSETGTHRCKEAFNPEAWARPGSRITPRIGCEARLP